MVETGVDGILAGATECLPVAKSPLPPPLPQRKEITV